MDIKTPLCLCNNCDILYIDTNPQVGQKLFNIPVDRMEELLDHSCPHCRVDDCLVDYEGEIEPAYHHTEESVEVWTWVPVRKD